MDTPVHLYSLLGATILSSHTLYTLCKGYARHSRLSHLASDSRPNGPFLLRILVKYELSRSLALSSLLLEVVSLVMGEWVIRSENQYIYHSVLSKGEHTPYYDFNFALSYYHTALLATAISISLLFSLRGKITRTLSTKLMLSMSIGGAKGILDLSRYLDYRSTREYQLLQIACDMTIIILLSYLFYFSYQLKGL